ncbi:MAG: hypothetical protein KJ583_00730 [Nanoarchaeota archaeon]|nr:hypothetical protein [Nanoarchaeota archaeon]MBU1269622.1 hypothetical protein [Nanoarchaeota archaeon]MBU1603814.1 hypothetical protein [Nanoarchaeota archaeon]MBU2443246.1 hypothetical protein [Nanoarchaeota archaeon]
MSSQEFQEKKKKVLIRKVTPEKVLEEIAQGNKFIVLEDDIDNVPDGYTLVDMKYKDSSFKTLVPEQIVWYLANPGEGNIDDALDTVSDFYGNVKDFEEDAMTEGKTSVQDTNWATTARDSHQVYLINKLTKNGKDYDDKVLKELDLNDSYVKSRVEGIAALLLEKTPEQLEKNPNLKDVLKHVTINLGKETIKTKELQRQRCYVGSHWEYKDKYVPVTKVVEHTKTYSGIDSKVDDLEKEIHDYREKKHNGKTGRHDDTLIRTYINLTYVTKENPKAQLDIKPAEKVNKDEQKKDQYRT